jgi:hypothetical protein
MIFALRDQAGRSKIRKGTIKQVDGAVDFRSTCLIVTGFSSWEGDNGWFHAKKLRFGGMIVQERIK